MTTEGECSEKYSEYHLGTTLIFMEGLGAEAWMHKLRNLPLPLTISRPSQYHVYQDRVEWIVKTVKKMKIFYLKVLFS